MKILVWFYIYISFFDEWKIQLILLVKNTALFGNI